MTMNKAQILAIRDRIPTSVVKVGKYSFRLRGMTGTERDSFEATLQVGTGTPNLANLRARLLVRTIVDENDQRVFEDGDEDALGQLPAAVLDPLFTAAQKLSGVTKSDIEELLGNSGAAPGGDSSSA